MADLNGCDAAIVVTVADTQYVLCCKSGGERCYAVRYVPQHRCKHDFSGCGGCHCKQYSVEHMGPNHSNCRFTIEW